jgi:hypothetical protein
VRYNDLQSDEDEEKNRHKPNDNPSQLILGKFAYDQETEKLGSL